jgi:dolichyl-phosphate-mannose--protein O-mannosyl transferase
MVLHTRSAMLEGPQLFFILAALLYFIVLFQKKDLIKKIEYFYLGLLIGLAVSVKVNSLVIALVYPVLAWKDHWPEIKAVDWKTFFQDRKESLRRTGKLLGVLALKAAAAAGGIAAIFCQTYYIHFSLGEKVLQNRTYRASADYLLAVKSYQTSNPVNFPVMLRDSLEFTSHYEKGVPLWDPTKKDENGSPAFTWPIGYKSINYRWEKSLGRVAYFYYQGNPVIWFAALFAVFIAFGLVLAKLVIGFQVKDTQKLGLLGFFTFLYFAYMAAMTQIDRVLYLYHYIIPLVFALIALYLLFLIVFEELVRTNDKFLYYTVALIALEVFAAFLFFSPFTYGIPLAASDFVKRAWMRAWDLKYLLF